MTLAAITALLSRVHKANPDLVSDEKFRRYIMLVVEEARKLPADRPPVAPCDVDPH